jgi:hypothetical protein
MDLPKTFYERQEWKALRYRVLRNNGNKCLSCNRTNLDGVILHVDHIKPRSIYPELALTESNLQVLCADCNFGKSNKYSDDFRRVNPVPETTALTSEQIGNKILSRIKRLLSEAEQLKCENSAATIMKLYLDFQRILAKELDLTQWDYKGCLVELDQIEKNLTSKFIDEVFK